MQPGQNILVSLKSGLLRERSLESSCLSVMYSASILHTFKGSSKLVHIVSLNQFMYLAYVCSKKWVCDPYGNNCMIQGSHMLPLQHDTQ